MPRRTQAPTVAPRSVIPGRQRWDVGVLLGRANVAELLEDRLREVPGVVTVRANPVTGRVLLLHEVTLSSAEVDRLVRATVGSMIRTVLTPPQPSVATRRNLAPTRASVDAGTSLALIGGAAAVLALARRPALMGLGAVLVGTVVVVRRGWRRSSRSYQNSAGPPRSARNPVLQIVRSHRRRFYLVLLLSGIEIVLDIAPSLTIGWMAYVLMTGSNAVLVSLGLTSIYSQLLFLSALTLLLSGAIAVMSYYSTILWGRLAQSVQHEWRTTVHEHVQRLRLRHLEGDRTSRLARVLTDDVDQLGRFLSTSVPFFLQVGTSILVVLPMFLVFAPNLAWISLLPLPVMSWLSFAHHEQAAPDYADNGVKGSLLNHQLLNNIGASATVKSFCAEQYEADRIDRLSEEYQRSNEKITERTAGYTQTVRVCGMVSLAGVLTLGSREVIDGALPFPVFSLLVSLPQRTIGQLQRLGEVADQYQRTVAALDRILELCSLPVEVADTGRSLARESILGEIVLDRVTFCYPGREPVLRDLSLRIAPRRTTGIVGVTGAGKTTIAKLLMRFHDVSSGRILLDGQDIREIKLHDLRDGIAFVAQDAFLFDGTAGENIRYGSFDADRQQIVTAAGLAEAHNFIEGMPEQYDTMIGERGVTLSGGQKQRLSLTRAILKDAPIIILDEATSAVDNETEAAIQQALANFAKGRTVVMIAHRLSTIRHADWIYVLDAGGVVAEEGTHNDLLARDGVYATLWRLQIGG